MADHGANADEAQRSPVSRLEDEDFWRRLLFAATGVTAVVYLYNAFFIPGTLTYAPYTIQDDARQFLAWMSRLADPQAMPGDLIADYWQSVCPWLYRAFYQAALAIGLEPVVFARLLPAALLFLSAWMAWRAALLMTKRPAAAFVAAALVTGFVLHEDSIYSATPRAFSAPLFLVFIDGLLRGRAWVMVPALFLLGLLYPTTALVGLVMVGLSRIGWRPFRIDLGARTWILCGVAAGAVLLAVLPFAGATDRWEPTLTIAEALAEPNLGTPQGRSAIVGLSGRIDYLCSARMGVLPEIVPCWSTRWAVLPNALLMGPMLLLAWAAVRRQSHRTDGEPGNFIHAWALIAALAWWVVAVAVAFQLHLPSRYTQRTLSILEFLAIGQMLGLVLDRWMAERRRPGAALLGGGIALFLAISFLTPTPGLRRPSDAAALDRIAALPPGTMIGGVSDELGAVPALTGRPVLATIEHSIPYHTRYFGPMKARLEASLMAVSTRDPAVIAAYVQAYGVQVIALDEAFVTRAMLPPSYATVVPDATRAAAFGLSQGRSLAQQRAEACALHRGPLLLLDASCLATGSRRPI